MTKISNKSKIYLAIIAGSLLFAAGSLAWQKKQAGNFPPPPPEQQEEIFYQEEVLPPEDLPRGWVKPQMPAGPLPTGGGVEERVEIYLSHPVMKAFNDEILAAVGDVSPEDFTTGAAHEKYFNNPQIQKILLKYSKDPAFLELMRQMMSDKALNNNAR